MLLVDPGLASMLDEKSETFTLDASLQVNPFTVTPVPSINFSAKKIII